MKTLNEIVPVIKNESAFLRDHYGLLNISIFGSYARGEQTETSDLDLLVEFDEKKYPGLISLLKIENYLAEKTGVKIDLVPADGLKEKIKDKIYADLIRL